LPCPARELLTPPVNSLTHRGLRRFRDPLRRQVPAPSSPCRLWGISANTRRRTTYLPWCQPDMLPQLQVEEAKSSTREILLTVFISLI
jgi:hypothetical protein